MAKVRKDVLFHEDERVDLPDLTAIGELARTATQHAVQVLAGAAPRASHDGRTHLPGCVWRPGDDIVFEPATDNRITIPAGTVLVLTGVLTGDNGDVIEIDDDVILDDYCPSVGDPNWLLMARIAAAVTEVDNDDRVFYDDGTEGETTDNVATRAQRTIEWTKVDGTDDAAITAAEGDGYQWVASLTYSAGPTYEAAWHLLLPTQEDEATPVESLASAVIGLTRAVEALMGGGKHWTADPDNTLDDDELHADRVYAADRLIVGAVDDEDVRKCGIEENGSSDALPAMAFHALKDAGDALVATNMVGRMGPAYSGGSADEIEHLIVGPGGWGADLVADDEAAILAFANRKWALEAKYRSADGLRVLIYKDKATGTEFLALRSDGRIEMIEAQTVVRRLSLTAAQPAYTATGTHWRFSAGLYWALALASGTYPEILALDVPASYDNATGDDGVIDKLQTLAIDTTVAAGGTGPCRAYLYQHGRIAGILNSVGDDGSGNDYVEWDAATGEIAEKTLSINTSDWSREGRLTLHLQADATASWTLFTVLATYQILRLPF